MSKTSTDSSSPRRPYEPLPAGSVPESPLGVRGTLVGLGVVPSKLLGQSFLVDPFVADAEAVLASDAADRPVVEIGGGLGILTAALVRRGIPDLTVIERDSRLAHHLRTTFGPRVKVWEADALEVEIPAGATVVGNLPFSSATPILLALFARRVPRIVALVQKEVAARLAAGPGSRTYGRLSIGARLYGEVELFQEVPPTAFYPAPAVRGQIFTHTARPGPLPVPSVDRLEEVVRTLFSSRRKQLGNLLPRVRGVGRDPGAVAAAAEWPAGWARKRPEELPPEAYFRLASVLTYPGATPAARGRGPARARPRGPSYGS